ncbi:MAG: hypothetical protein WBQ60_07895 [Asticcacaulis sp.]
MTSSQVLQLSVYAVAALCCAWAFWKGGRTEKRGAVYIFIAWTLSLLLQSHAKTGPGILVNIIDIVTLCLLVHLSLVSKKIWTIFAAASQLDAIASHLAQVFLPYGQRVYVSVLAIWGGYGLLICLFAGTIGHQLDLKRQSTEKT